MGEHDVSKEHTETEDQTFVQALLADLQALEKMLETDRIEHGFRRIGAEQEMFLIDRAMHPAPVAPEVLSRVTDSRLTTEIGRFNLEANLSPRRFEGTCLSAMEAEIEEMVELASVTARERGANVLLTGILPTIRQADLKIENLTPNPRYEELNRTLNRLRGGEFYVHIKGLDELQTTHDNVLFEACCTSFQIHLQVDPDTFARDYNLAQAVTAPVLAAATNSPILLGQRLWHETRIALFQHSVDERSSANRRRGTPPRVSFGESWIERSVLEIFREEIARFRVILTRRIEEDPLAVLAAGELPQLTALRLHNGTVWRWNRPCYGVADGTAHLRIEMRVLPAGPTIVDEMANAAFFYGLMAALPDEYGAIENRMSFDDAKENFLAAARQGIKAPLTWIDGRAFSADALVLDHLLPLARTGLKQADIDATDTDRYLDIIEERVRRRQTGSVWALGSLAGMGDRGTPEQRLHALTASILAQQIEGRPVHLWHPAVLPETTDWAASFATVGQFMATDLFTVRPTDVVDLAASLMEWKHIRHVPVEDDDGRLVGLVSHRDLLRLFAAGAVSRATGPIPVKDIMTPAPITIRRDTPTREAVAIMREKNIGCLPVLDGDHLVGLVTAHDFLKLFADFFDSQTRAGESGG